MSESIFQIEMLPAREGDCLILSYGRPDDRRQILIDGGRASTWKDLKARLQNRSPEERRFELLVITHVDRDHIEGVLKMIEDEPALLSFGDIWFNGYQHLTGECLEAFGPVQGELLTTALLERRLSWNRAFDRCAAATNQDGSPRSIELAGGLTLKIVSPNPAKLQALEPEWVKAVAGAGMVPGAVPVAENRPPDGLEVMGALSIDKLADARFEDDSSNPNGSSIAFLAEYGDRRVLLTGDAHVDRLIEALTPLAQAEGGKLRLDATKLSHHGSKFNVSSELLKLLDCRRYLVSTNGSYFDHPDREAIARVIKYGGREIELVFNYRSDYTRIWDDDRLRDRWKYKTSYPIGGDGYSLVTL